METKLILNDRLSGIQVLDFSDIVPKISKADADDFVQNFHDKNPGMHFAVSIVSLLIMIHHRAIDNIDEVSIALTKGVIVCLVAFPDLFNKTIEYSFHSGHEIEMHPGGPLDKYLAYEAMDSDESLSWRN